jgi:hypothetical protein
VPFLLDVGLVFEGKEVIKSGVVQPGYSAGTENMVSIMGTKKKSVAFYLSLNAADAKKLGVTEQLFKLSELYTPNGLQVSLCR